MLSIDIHVNQVLKGAKMFIRQQTNKQTGKQTHAQAQQQDSGDKN